MDQESDPRLVELAQAGDQQAFAELYTRYFDPVYDFVARMTRNRDEAADIAQDAFLKAMNALGGLRKGASFKGWIFTIARNTALNRLERANRTRPFAFEDAEGEEVTFDVIDSDRFADPAEAAQANAMAALVWQAAAGLDPKQLSLLDLHLRQGLDSGEIADVMGVTKNNGYVMLNRLTKAVEDSIGAFIMLNDGRRYCDDLDSALTRAEIREMSPETRKVVEKHVAQCDLCEERKRKLVAPLAVFGAFAMVGSPAGARAQILNHLMRQWPGPAAMGSGANQPPTGGRSAAEQMGQGGKVIKMFAGLGIAAGVLLMLLLVPISPIALTRSDGEKVIQAGGDGPGNGGGAVSPLAGNPSPTPTSATASAQATTTPSSAQPTPGGSATTEAIIGSATNTPETKTPTAGPGTPTAAATATATATKTPVTPTNTPVPTPSPTAQPCAASLSANPFINASTGSTNFELYNSFCKSTDFTIGVSQGAGWLGVQPPSGTLQSGGQRTVSITANVQSLGEGTTSGTIHVSWAEGAFDVTVQVTREGASPAIARVSGQCVGSLSPTLSFSASVTDDFAVNTVTLQYRRTDGTNASAPMTLQDGLYRAQVTGPISSYSVVATDFAGHTTYSASVTCP
jgi:RNA polymerase sigma factor (sigma-70 family)